MKTIKVTSEMMEHAQRKSSEMGRLRNSITKGEGNFIGFLGEMATKFYLKIPLEEEMNTYDYDIIFNNQKIDVKSKKTSVMPVTTHEGSVSASNVTQECDLYLFTRVLDVQPSYVYLMGYYPKKEYFENATLLREGQRDGAFTVRADCWNMIYGRMKPVEHLIGELSEKEKENEELKKRLDRTHEMCKNFFEGKSK